MALTNSQYDAIMRIYEQKHLRTHDRLTRHYSEIYEKIPRIREIDEEISHLGVAGAQALIDGNADAPARFRERLHALRDEKQALLAGSGYPSDYLEPSYECPDGQDTGYLDGRKCRCFQKAEIDLLYTQSNLQDILAPSWAAMPIWGQGLLPPMSRATRPWWSSERGRSRFPPDGKR